MQGQMLEQLLMFGLFKPRYQRIWKGVSYLVWRSYGHERSFWQWTTTICSNTSFGTGYMFLFSLVPPFYFQSFLQKMTYFNFAPFNFAPTKMIFTLFRLVCTLPPLCFSNYYDIYIRFFYFSYLIFKLQIPNKPKLNIIIV